MSRSVSTLRPQFALPMILWWVTCVGRCPCSPIAMVSRTLLRRARLIAACATGGFHRTRRRLTQRSITSCSGACCPARRRAGAEAERAFAHAGAGSCMRCISAEVAGRLSWPITAPRTPCPINVPMLMAGFAAATRLRNSPTRTDPPPSGLAKMVVTPCRTSFSATGFPIASWPSSCASACECTSMNPARRRQA